MLFNLIISNFQNFVNDERGKKFWLDFFLIFPDSGLITWRVWRTS